MTDSNEAAKAAQGAAKWDAKLRGAHTNKADRQRFEEWLVQTPANRIQYERLQSALSVLKAADVPELDALRRDTRRTATQAGRRNWIGAATAAVAAAGVFLTIGFALQTPAGSEVTARLGGSRVYQTGLNQRQEIELTDGSIVTLDSDTRLLVRMRKEKRSLILTSGRALFHVAKDANRPFVVRAGDRTVTALGTVFDVLLDEGRTRVTLVEGRVAVRPVVPGRATTQYLQPHQQFVEARGSAPEAPQFVDVDATLSWVNGQLVFQDEPLAEAAHKMNQYARMKIEVAPAVAGLKVSGMFRTGNQTGFAGALQTVLPVEVRTGEKGQILVEPSSAGTS